LPLEQTGSNAPTGDSMKDKKDSKPKAPAAAILVEEENPRDTRIHVRGDFLRRGDAVQAGTPRVLHPFAARGARPDRLTSLDGLWTPRIPSLPASPSIVSGAIFSAAALRARSTISERAATRRPIQNFSTGSRANSWNLRFPLNR